MLEWNSIFLFIDINFIFFYFLRSDTQIKQFKEKLSKRHQLPDLRKINDVHVLCGFVKEFLNNLNEHLVTYEQWPKFAKACGKNFVMQ